MPSWRATYLSTGAALTFILTAANINIFPECELVNHTEEIKEDIEIYPSKHNSTFINTLLTWVWSTCFDSY